MRKFASLLIVFLVSICIGQPALAYVFELDSLSIERTGAMPLSFTDEFDDGVPPPESPAGPNTYIVRGGVGPEIGGKLTLDSKDAARGVSSTGEPELVQTIMGNTRIDGGQPGFYLGDVVSVTAIYDLIVPAYRRELYGVRFTDRAPALGRPGNDLPQIRVLRLDDAGLLGVQLVNASFVDHTLDFIATEILDAAHEQIALTLDLDAAGFVTASYAYVDGGVMGSIMSLAGASPVQIFRDEDWTRVEVIVQKIAITEPGSLALVCAGVLGFGYRRRSRTS